MKRTILYIMAMFLFSPLFGQDSTKKKQTFPFDEISLSANYTHVEYSGQEGRFGCGINIYHAFMSEKEFNFVIGLEYNYTSQYKDYVSISRGSYYDLIFHMHNISIPFYLRFNIGKKIKFFPEAGFFIDLPLGSKVTGHGTWARPDDTWGTVLVSFNLNEGAGISGVNYGPSFGMGIRIPMKSIEWIVKADYKAGLKTFDTSYDDLMNQYFRLSIGIRKNWNVRP